MKKMKFFAIVLAMAIMFNSCIGSFKLSSKVLKFNKSMGNKWINELVFLGFLIIPVYEVTFLIDGLILNTIEFWTGSNPVSMKQGDKEIKIVEKDGLKYEITATKNQFHILQLQGPQSGQEMDLVYDENSGNWSAVKDGNVLVTGGKM